MYITLAIGAFNLAILIWIIAGTIKSGKMDWDEPIRSIVILLLVIAAPVFLFTAIMNTVHGMW